MAPPDIGVCSGELCRERNNLGKGKINTLFYILKTLTLSHMKLIFFFIIMI